MERKFTGGAGLRVAGALWLFLLSLQGASLGAASLPPGQIVFLLEYVGSDYDAAVQDGKVVNAFEYAEVANFAQTVEDAYLATLPNERGSETQERLGQLRALLASKASSDEVRALVRTLVPAMSQALGVQAWPLRSPDLERGRRLYERDCARCHGQRGRGDGPDGAGLEPLPTSFHDERLRDVPPRQLAGAIRYGIEGTAMPAYGDAMSDDEIWDLAFHIVALRHGAEVETAEERSSPETEPVASARDLERAFTNVAADVFPSVVGVTALVSEADAGPVADGATGWSGAIRDRNPGFRPLRAGSGFLIDTDGTMFTALHLIRDSSGRLADRVEVEFENDVRALARVRGVEPMIDLAVLEVDVPFATRPVTVGDAGVPRVGQWIISVGDPPGVERAFVPGVLSAVPRRECYQETPSETLYQTSLWLEAGAFGGPVVDLSGRTIGIAQPRPGHLPLPGVPSALRILPIELAMTIHSALATAADEISPWLGFSVLELGRDVRRRLADPPRTGVYIDGVYDPSPASRAGIEVGDVLLSIDGNRLLSVADFQRWLYLLGVGTPVDVVVHRDGAEKTVRVEIEQRPAELVP